MAIFCTDSITLKSIRDGKNVDVSNCELAINQGDYKTASEIDDVLKFMENGFIISVKPMGGKVTFRFESSGFMPVNCMLKYGKNTIKSIRVPLQSSYDYEIDFKTHVNQIIYMYGNISLDIRVGQLQDILQWGNLISNDVNKTLGYTKLIGGVKIFKDFPKIKWTALDEPNFEYIVNMDEFCIGSKLDIDMSNWNVDNVATHLNFIDQDNASILPNFI